MKGCRAAFRSGETGINIGGKIGSRLVTGAVCSIQRGIL
jgi:hypothetical protein